MAATIVVLDEATVNKIAAGEVVERPASVVKELVENSLDAGSTRIDIDVHGGGLRRIRVLDNGCGMGAADARLALERHATSKIRDASDLVRLSTLGFRGEALPSIAAVSRLELRTMPAGVPGAVGTLIAAEGGRITVVTETACPPGTCVTVRDLFFNTPARLKHLQSAGAETARIADVISAAALAFPHVSFRLSQDGREVLFSPGQGDLLNAIGATWGVETGREMLEFAGEEEGIKVQGYIARPSLTRANRDRQAFVVNRRPVQSKLLAAALEEAYHTLLPAGRYPVAVVHLAMDPGDVDPNVHPTKVEVRLAHEQRLRRVVVEAVRRALLQAYLVPDMVLTSPSPPVDMAGEPEAARDIGRVREGGRGFAAAAAAGEQAPLFSGFHLIGQALGTYILAQDGEDIVIVDQHAACERVLYHAFLKAVEAEGAPVQELLVPVPVEMSYREAAVLHENLPILRALGFRVEEFGANSFLVRALPSRLTTSAASQLVQDIAGVLASGTRPGPADGGREEEVIMAACRAAAKANEYLLRGEMERLLTDLARTPNPYTCPHGRPTMLRLSSRELAHRFKRS